MVLTSSLIQVDLHLHLPTTMEICIITPIAVNGIELTNAQMGTKVSGNFFLFRSGIKQTHTQSLIFYF